MRILVAIDGSEFSEAVIQALIAQAPPKGSEVRVLHVIEPLPAIYGGAEWGYVMDWQAVTREQRKQAEAIVARAAETRAAGFQITTPSEEGAESGI
jgi:nucleotide-binding universal stress UspA family protein